MGFSWQSVKPSHQVLIGASIGVLTLLGAFAYDKWTLYQSEIADARGEARRTAELLARHTERAFDGIDAVLREIARLRLETEDQDGGNILDYRLLQAVHGGTPVLKTIGWVNSEGERTVTSLSADPPPVSFAENDNFRALRNRGPADPDDFVSAPFFSDILGTVAVFVAHRTVASDGKFVGLAYGVLDPIYFSKVFQAADFGDSSVITLSKIDGTILAAHPVVDLSADSPSVESPLSLEAIGQARSGSMRIGGEANAADQIVGFALTEDRRFLLSIAVPFETALADFYDELLGGLWRVLLAVCLLFAIAGALVAQTRRREALGNRLRHSERRFRDFAQASGDWFWETDAEHRMIWISKAVETTAGVPQDWHIGKRRRDMCSIPLMSDPGMLAEHEALLDRHEPFSDFEYPRETADGVVWIRTSGVPIFDDDGNFLGYRGSARDITDFIDAKARLKDATDAIPGGFMLFNEAGELVYKNAPTQQPTGLAAFETLGETFETIIRRSAYGGMVEEAKQDPEAWIRWRIERHRAADRPSLIHVNGRAIELIERPTSDGGRVLLRFDVTDRELAYEELRRARDAANAANQAKSDFLASMSHELRTPLNAIIGFGEILERSSMRALKADQISEYSGYIVSSGRLLLNLVSDVLDLSSIESGHMKVDLQSVGIRAIVDRAVENVRPLATQREIDLQIDVPDAAGNVRADGQRTIQLLLNLLSNAIKYNNPKGFVRVEVLEENGQVTFLVTDSGPGIAPEKAARLFSPFDRLGAEFGNIEGTGIGLALSKRLAAAMSGQLGYYPAQPSGSTFWFTLPASEGATVSASDRRVTNSVPDSLGAFTVLCIEDNPINMRIVEHAVGDVPDLTLLKAMTGTEGLNRAQVNQPDVVFLDLSLPDMSGYDVLTGLRANPDTAGIPVIALTASAMAEDIQRGEKEGFFRYLTKPLDLAAFHATLREALADRRAPAPSAVRAPAATAPAPTRSPHAEEASRLTDDDLIDTDRLEAIRSLTQPAICDTLLEQLCEDIERQASTYSDVIASDDLPAAERAMHSLKGQCLNMGAVALGEFASQLYQAARIEDRATLEGAREEFTAICSATVTRLKREVGTERKRKDRSAVNAA